METQAKQLAAAAAAAKGLAPLGLERFLPIKDVRKLIWRHLDARDRELVRCAQNSQRVPRLEKWEFARICAVRGYLELLQWALEQPEVAEHVLCRVTADAAAEGGHIPVLQWLLANGVRLDECACNLAAYGGHIETLRWLRVNGVPWNNYACAWAAKYGHLECLKWLCSNGAPLDYCAFYYAQNNGHLKIVEWLRANSPQ